MTRAVSVAQRVASLMGVGPRKNGTKEAEAMNGQLSRSLDEKLSREMGVAAR